MYSGLVIEETFSNDQRHSVTGTQFIQPLPLNRARKRCRRIVGLNYYHRPRSLSHRLLQRQPIDLPSVVINQRVRDERHVLEIGKKIKQRITWLGYENFIARIRQQPEDIQISLTGAGCDYQVFRIKFAGEGASATPARPTRLVFRYVCPRAPHALRLRYADDH